MGIPFVILLVIGVLVAVGALVWVMTTRRRTRPVDAADRAVTHRSADFPSPGGASPTRGGRPAPGSQASREQHGKP
jgi:hypothetical protein